MRKILALTLILCGLSACANKGLRELDNPSAGPDEFIVEPKKPLQEPSSFSDLPTPTPGQSNLTDTNPVQEAIVAVGGTPSSPTGPIPASDGALVNAASRFGITADIRETLAATDADFRRRKARFTQYRIVPVDRYNEAYKREAIDPHLVARQWRGAGARTPAYPPQE